MQLEIGPNVMVMASQKSLDLFCFQLCSVENDIMYPHIVYFNCVTFLQVHCIGNKSTEQREAENKWAVPLLEHQFKAEHPGNWTVTLEHWVSIYKTNEETVQMQEMWISLGKS